MLTLEAPRPRHAPQDRLFVDVQAPEELAAWARHFRTSKERLLQVVTDVGAFAADVERELEGEGWVFD